MPHIRYSGSIERMDQGEREDDKSIALLEIGPKGLRSAPEVIPVKATPFYDVQNASPRDDLPQLREMYPDAETALVRLKITYRPGEDNLQEILTALDQIFPRWYVRTHQSAIPDSSRITLDDLFPESEAGENASAQEPEGVVLQYVQRMLGENDLDRDELLALAHELFDNN
jgi:hypothetical protein